MRIPLALAAVLAAALPGCGSPDYCAARDDLEQSVRGLGDVQVLQGGGLDELRSQVEEIETAAKTLASEATADFPDEAAAIESSIETLKGTLQELPASPEPQDLARVAGDASAVVTSVGDFTAATDSECS